MRAEGIAPGLCAEHGGLMWSNAMRACITPDDVIRGGCRWQPFDRESPDSHEADNPQGVWCCDEHRRQYQKVSTPTPAESKVEDLMAALEQSVKEARHAR